VKHTGIGLDGGVTEDMTKEDREKLISMGHNPDEIFAFMMEAKDIRMKREQARKEEDEEAKKEEEKKGEFEILDEDLR